ncbi:MAG: DUF2007 domain-containing protein [Phycisphaerae bacterium]|nr:DUF2007 domain-containing protein [Phycisphaerae bacterium]
MSNESGNPVVLTTVLTEGEATLIQTELEQNGITARVAGGESGGFRFEALGKVEVLVYECDLERAQAVLRAIEARDDEPNSPDE